MKRLIGSVERLNQVLHGIANGITVQDPEGKLVFVNRAAARMMNCASPEEALQKGGLEILNEFKFYSEQGLLLSSADLPGRKALGGVEEPEMIIAYAPVDTPDDMRWVSIKATPIFDENGEVILAVNVMQDITTLKETERKLKEANDRITKLLEQTLKT